MNLLNSRFIPYLLVVGVGGALIIPILMAGPLALIGLSFIVGPVTILAALGFTAYISLKLFARITIWTAKKTITVPAMGALWVVKTGSEALDRLKIFRPAPAFSTGFMPMMMATATTEHRTDGQRGYTKQRESGSGDDEDADGDHAKVEYQDGRRHEPRNLTWNHILQQIQMLKREFYEIKNGKQTGDINAETG